MEFGPHNHVVRFCIQGMAAQEKGNADEATGLFLQAWNSATDDPERFLSAHFIAGCQKQVSDRLKWLETALNLALTINDDTVRSAFPVLYSNIGKCLEELGDSERAAKNLELAKSLDAAPTDKGPFFHGTKAELKVGDLLTAGKGSNYTPDLTMNHVYFTALMHGAGLAAELAKGEGRARVYAVAPTGPFENDPNVTNSKFPGNPTRSYRSEAPLKVVAEIDDWKRMGSEELEKWRKKLADQKGRIIN